MSSSSKTSKKWDWGSILTLSAGVLGFIALIVVIIVVMKKQTDEDMKKPSTTTREGFSASGLSAFSRPTFNSNLDPTNPNLRFDPNVYGGFIRGNPTTPQNLAVAQPMENSFPLGIQGGEIIDAASVLPAGPHQQPQSPQQPQPSKEPFNLRLPPIDFSSVVKDTTQNFAGPTSKSELTMKLQNPNDYITPQEMLPIPDMRQPLARDPSDPANFMYDRTLFAPLKKRNLNYSDRLRGDLDIQPIKTGWFDIATIPHIDLTKGYFGYYTDINQFQDLQDVVYERNRGDAAAGTELTTILENIDKDMTKPNLKYAPRPELQVANVPMEGNSWGQSQMFKL